MSTLHLMLQELLSKIVLLMHLEVGIANEQLSVARTRFELTKSSTRPVWRVKPPEVEMFSSSLEVARAQSEAW